MKTIVHYGNKRRKQMIAKQERELLKKLGERKEEPRGSEALRDELLEALQDLQNNFACYCTPNFIPCPRCQLTHENVKKLLAAAATTPATGSEALALEIVRAVKGAHEATMTVYEQRMFKESVVTVQGLLAAATAERTPPPLVPASEYARIVNDLCEAISRIRWARGTDKLDAAIFEAVRLQGIADGGGYAKDIMDGMSCQPSAERTPPPPSDFEYRLYGAGVDKIIPPRQPASPKLDAPKETK